LDHERMWRNIKFADIKITVLVITDIVPINLHWAPKVRRSALCTERK